MNKGTSGIRFAEIDRDTQETKVHIIVDLDGGTKQDVETGIGFFDHMLKLMAFHSGLDLGVSVEGDLAVDDHHTIEDVGIVLGRALKKAIGDGEGIMRYSHNLTPMDEALATVALDVSGRAYLSWDVEFKRDQIGFMSTECVREFFHALAFNAGFTLHVKVENGVNDHHICEAVFKGVGRAIQEALRKGDRRTVPSTKGKIG